MNNIVVAFLLNLCWVIFSCLLSVVVVLLLGTTILCKAAERLGKDACAVLNDLKVLYFNGTTGACEGRGVCIKIEETWGSSLGTFVGSLVICMSMVIFVMTLSANFTHLEHRIKDSKRDKFHDENGTEMSNM
ncbi:uncharacterized protein LOC141899861 isoform X2 [Tubulanus polymorphus]|uniref:uncharacterized protein LOC141899861 isoform X2 n=1 Tax=Tubulanus polymorphus TaxID=672921 RepID=UPI003DA1DF76